MTKSSLRAGWAPFGMGEVKPHHYLEILRTAWQNRAELPYAMRILTQGVCDGCALGQTGLKDFTWEGIHLCTVRLKLLKLNTMGPLEISLLEDLSRLTSLSSRELRDLGRLPYPMLRRRGEPGFRRVSWEGAFRVLADRWRRIDPKRVAFFLTSRGLTNETYYVAQKVARFLGTSHIDNSSRLCHAPSTVGLKQSLGVSASTCSYIDWIGTELLVFFGSDVPNNQPVAMKYIHYAREAGTRVLVVNPVRERGLERYWVPSVPSSALFGTRISDEFILVHTGGDVAFINGVLKILIQGGSIDREFVKDHTTGFDKLEASLEAQSFAELERLSGVSQEEMRHFAAIYAEARTAVFVWSMGLTQHRFGVDNVRAVVNLALARGMLGREKCGLMAIRGHSGVQGGAEMGAVPDSLPGGIPLEDANIRRFEKAWGFPFPHEKGMNTAQMIDAAHEGGLEILWAAGGNFLETLPEPDYVREALARIPLRVHQDIVLTHQMFVDSEEMVVLLPAQTRYEQRGGGTETSTERRVYFSPEIPGRRIGEAMTEWEIFLRLAEAVRPEAKELIHIKDATQIREEIAWAVPFYDGIQRLKRAGDAFQWGGPLLCRDGRCPTPDGRARFTATVPTELKLPEGTFLMSTRRGLQFNSMVQGDLDPQQGARRRDVLMNTEDAGTLGLHSGDPVRVTSEVGTFDGFCKVTRIKPRNVQLYWPEANVLIRRGVLDPVCGIPDYNALVQISSGVNK